MVSLSLTTKLPIQTAKLGEGDLFGLDWLPPIQTTNLADADRWSLALRSAKSRLAGRIGRLGPADLRGGDRWELSFGTARPS